MMWVGRAELASAVSIHGGPLEAYDFHGLEVLQSVVEVRRGGAQGISTVQFLQGDALWWGGGNLLELDAPFGGFRRVVRGFDRRHEGVREAAFAASIDAGSGFGGPLVAACFSVEGELVETIEG